MLYSKCCYPTHVILCQIFFNSGSTQIPSTEVISTQSPAVVTEVTSALSQTQSTSVTIVTNIPTQADVGHTTNDYITPEPMTLSATSKYLNTVDYNYTSSGRMDNDTIAMSNMSYEARTRKTGSYHTTDGPADKIISTTKKKDLSITATEKSVEDTSIYESEYYGEKQFAMVPFVEEIILPGMHTYIHYIAIEWSKHWLVCWE